MNLFTYLGAKNGKFTLPHKSDLFAYLLGKNSKLPVQTASGTTLEITAKKTNLLELTLDKMCSQEGTPTPDNPVEVNVAQGYRNLLENINSTSEISGVKITKNNDGSLYLKGKATANIYYYLQGTSSVYPFSLNAGTYTLSGGISSGVFIRLVNASINKDSLGTANTFTLDETTSFYCLLRITTNTEIDTTIYPMIVEGNQQLPYVPYGTNYINLNITDGVNSINKQIPLNDNFIGGIGDYKDELIIDKNGHAKLNKKIGKVVLDGSENWNLGSASSNDYYIFQKSERMNNANEPTIYSNNFIGGGYISASTTIDYEGIFYNDGALTNSYLRIWIEGSRLSEKSATAFKTWLSTHNTDVYYVLETPTTINLGTIDISLFKGSNIITNSDNCNMTIKYY